MVDEHNVTILICILPSPRYYNAISLKVGDSYLCLMPIIHWPYFSLFVPSLASFLYDGRFSIHSISFINNLPMNRLIASDLRAMASNLIATKPNKTRVQNDICKLQLSSSQQNEESQLAVPVTVSITLEAFGGNSGTIP